MPCRIFVLLVMSAMILIFVLAADLIPSSAIPKARHPSWTTHTK